MSLLPITSPDLGYAFASGAYLGQSAPQAPGTTTAGTPQPGDPSYVAPPSGLVNSPTAPPTAPNATPQTATYTPTQYTPGTFVPPPGADVATNVKNIVAEDSPLMQQAAERARQAMNAKGLLNSSIAAGAEQEAVIGAALPIAQQQAQQSFQAGATTFQAGERGKEFAATSINTALQLGATAENTNRLQTALATIDANTKLALSKLDVQNKQLLQSSSVAASA